MPRRWRLTAVAGAAGFLGLFFGWPLVTILERGLDRHAFTAAFGSPGLRRIAWFTVWQATASTVLTLLAGLLPAYVVARFRFRGRRALLAVITLPFVLPTVVIGAAFIALLPERWHQSVGAILLAHVVFNLAVVVRTVGGVWGQLDRDLEHAARTLGASPWQVARHVTVPLLRPALIAAGSIVFLFTFTSYGVITILGGPRHSTLEVELYRRAVLVGDLPVACVIAVAQLLAVGVLLTWWSASQARHSRPLALRAAAQRRPFGREWSVVVAGAALSGLAVTVPLGVLVIRSLRGGGRWTLAAWRAIGAEGWATVATSLRFAVAAAAIAVLVGGAAAFAVAGGGRVGRVLDAGLMLPLGTSAVTLGFGLLITFDAAPLDLRASVVIIPIAHALVGIPFVTRSMLPVLRAIDPHLREAAATLGANPRRAWLAVDVRLALRSLVGGAGFAFAVSLGEFGATSFLSRRGRVTVPMEISRALSRPGELSVGRGMAMATVLLVLTGLVVLLVDRLRPERSTW